MTQIVRWLHLSDFHVGKDHYAEEKIFDYIISHVKKRKEEGLIPDLIFLTGDLANTAKDSEYNTFWLDFVDPLQKEIGDGIEERTFAVPGNHDADRTKHSAFSQEDMSGPKGRYFDPNEEGRSLREILFPRFHAFKENDLSPTNCSFETASGSFTHIVDIRGKKIGIAGINTAWLSKNDKDERKLTPGKGLLEYALNGLKEAEFRIVLGHHPIEWFIPAQQRPIKSLLGQHYVLYLHGHMHEAWAEPTYGGGSSYLAIQSGAAFHAREGEIWRNGLVWGEVDLDAKEVRLQPWQWSSGQQAWILATEAFHENHRINEWWIYPLPGSKSAQQLAETSKQAIVRPPKGWKISKPDELSQYLKPLEEIEAIIFFNGAVPNWNIALSSSIPRRKIVARLTACFQGFENSSRPIVTLLLAAGCEGKTTAMLQAAYMVTCGQSKWRILRRVDDAGLFNSSEMLPLLNQEFLWLVVVDEADRISEEIFKFLQHMPSNLQGMVHFLIACRDTDWQASKANRLNWSSNCTFKNERLSGLDEEDAKAIVSAWAAFGNAGLGDLANIPENKRSTILEQKAHEEAKTNQGAFFGALLAVRHGNDLHNHARLMLERLAGRKIKSGGTLKDAIAFIAAMHSEGMEFLSHSVLAQALGCPVAQLYRNVLAPLGQEAAATSTSSFIFTRHRRIAEAMVVVLENDFSEDIAELFVELAKSAIDVYKSNEFVPDLGKWRYGLAEYFFEGGKVELALNIARGVLSREPQNNMTLVKLATMYRKAGVSDMAIKLFRGVKKEIKGHPGFYFEWANAEGDTGSYVEGTLLAAFSISDNCSNQQVVNDHARKALGMSLK